MKHTLLIFCFFLCAYSASANSFTGLWGGGGLAKTNNYGLSTSVGLTYYRAISYGIGIGASGFLQKYNLYYADQANQVAGQTVRFNAGYAYIAPTFVFHVLRSGQTQAYVNAGVGFSVGTKDSVHKWSYTEWSSNKGSYDSLIDGSKTLNTMAIRVGFGLIEYYTLGGNWRLAITEDVGILTGPLSTYTDATNPVLTSDMAKFFRPVLFSIHLGITYRTPAESDYTGGSRKRMSK